MKNFYRFFITPGTLCFDIGAHLGNRIHAWRRLGGIVVACEPHPQCFRFLQNHYGKKENIFLLNTAVSERRGEDVLHISSGSPTLSTISEEWIKIVSTARIFSGITWDSSVSVQVTTLDNLIEKYGLPGFIKIDTEGSELSVLKGLHHQVPALSFEYLPASLEIAEHCIEELKRLGNYRFNLSAVETMKMLWKEWKTGDSVLDYFSRLSADSRSGDVYARRSQ